MYPYVFLQISRRLECLLAVVFGTFVGFFTCVDPDVALEAIPSGKGLPALSKLTAERFVASVGALMNLQWTKDKLCKCKVLEFLCQNRGPTPVPVSGAKPHASGD